MLEFIKKIFAISTGNENSLKDIIQSGALLVDVRSGQEFASGSVKGAKNIPLDKIASQLFKLKGQSNIVVFCRSGVRSSQAKRILEANGFNNVYNGGTWQRVNSLIDKN